MFRNSRLPVLPLFCCLPYPELTFYTDDQLLLIHQQHEHLANGGLLDNFVLSVATDIVSAKTATLALKKELSGFANTCQELSYQNPFWDYDLLQCASDRSYYLPTDKLATIIQRSPSTFASKKSFTFQGFVIVRQSDRSGNSYVWSINANQ